MQNVKCRMQKNEDWGEAVDRELTVDGRPWAVGGFSN